MPYTDPGEAMLAAAAAIARSIELFAQAIEHHNEIERMKLELELIEKNYTKQVAEDLRARAKGVVSESPHPESH